LIALPDWATVSAPRFVRAKMTDSDHSTDVSFLRAFQRPAFVVTMVGQMILGLALAITLIAKFYMLVFGTEVCAPDGDLLGNMIRCTPVLEIVAHFLLGMAGLRVAGFMFQDRPRMILGPLMLCLVGVLLLFLSGLTLASASWPVAAIVVSLMLSIAAIVAGQVLRSRLRDRS
jgi:hypothetical protein